MIEARAPRKSSDDHHQQLDWCLVGVVATMGFMPLDPQLYGAFVLAVILICVIPGSDMVFVVASGARHGRRAGVVAAVGIQGGMLVHTVAAVAGLSALVASSAAAFEALRLAGAALLWLALAAVRRGRDAPRDETRPQDSTTSLSRVLRQGALTNLLNPKIVVFFLAFVPQFVALDEGHVSLQIALLGGTFMAVGLAIDAGIGVLAARAGGVLTRSARVSRALERIAAAVHVGLAARLVTER